MQDSEKTKDQLIADLETARKRISELEADYTEPTLADNQLRLLFEYSPDLICVASSEGRFLRLNAAWEATLGYTEQELLSIPFLDLIHPDDRDATMLEVARQLGGKATTMFINRYRCKDGSYKWLEWRATPAMNNTLLFAFARDITGHKQAEETIRKSEERFREVVEGTDNLITQVDALGRFLYVNPVARTIFGLEPKDCIGRLAFDFIYAEDREATRLAFQGWEKDKLSHVTFENRLVSQSGEVRQMSWTIDLHYDSEGNISFIDSIAQDITKRKFAENELRESVERIRRITDAAQDAIIMMDQDGLVTFWNPAAERILGFASNEAIGQDLHSLIAPERYHEAFRAAFPQFRLTGFGGLVGKTVDVAARRKDGEEIAVSFSLSALEIKGRWHAVGILRDITERKRLQSIMLQTEKMVSVGGLAAGMAHEINNPLGIILQSAQVVSMRLDPGVEANKAAAAEYGCDMACIGRYIEERGILKFLGSIREAGTRAAKIVGNMLEFSRKSETGKAPVSVNSVLDKSLELAGSDYDLKKKYDFRKITISRDYQPDLPPLTCIEVQLEQVFMNIFRNAAQAMSEQMDKGSPSMISLRTRLDGDNFHIEIEDNGPGMPESIHQRVFEPFFTTKEVGEGTGLGLSVSYFIIVTNHKGSIEVESTPGKGTRFTIQLPLDQTPAHTVDGQPLQK